MSLLTSTGCDAFEPLERDRVSANKDLELEVLELQAEEVSRSECFLFLFGLVRGVSVEELDVDSRRTSGLL